MEQAKPRFEIQIPTAKLSVAACSLHVSGAQWLRAAVGARAEADAVGPVAPWLPTAVCAWRVAAAQRLRGAGVLEPTCSGRCTGCGQASGAASQADPLSGPTAAMVAAPGAGLCPAGWVLLPGRHAPDQREPMLVVPSLICSHPARALLVCDAARPDQEAPSRQFSWDWLQLAAEESSSMATAPLASDAVMQLISSCS